MVDGLNLLMCSGATPSTKIDLQRELFWCWIQPGSGHLLRYSLNVEYLLKSDLTYLHLNLLYLTQIVSTYTSIYPAELFTKTYFLLESNCVQYVKQIMVFARITSPMWYCT